MLAKAVASQMATTSNSSNENQPISEAVLALTAQVDAQIENLKDLKQGQLTILGLLQ